MGNAKFPSEVTQELLEDEDFLKEFFNIVYNVRYIHETSMYIFIASASFFYSMCEYSYKNAEKFYFFPYKEDLDGIFQLKYMLLRNILDIPFSNFDELHKVIS